MAVQVPVFLQKTGADADVTYSATNYRLGLIAPLCQIPGVIDPKGSNGLLVTQRGAGANFSVDVASGYAVIAGGDVANQGSYIALNDATVNVATPSAPASGTRTHRLILQIRDKLNNGAYTTYDGQLQLLQDTGSGTPATPASAISLATVSIAAGQANVSNANITDTRAWARWATSITGTLSVENAGWAATDATRPPSWRYTPDGFVEMFGWVSRTAGNGFSAVANTLYGIVTGLPSYARPSGNRDGVVASSAGPYGCIRIVTQVNGIAYTVFNSTTTINVGDWVSLDGLKFKTTA